MPKPIELRVFMNPFCAELDAEGRACGAVRFAPQGLDSDAFLPYIGCHLIATPRAAGDGRVPKAGTLLHHVVKTGDQTDWDHVWEYDTEPTTIVLTPKTTAYYLDHLRTHGHHGPALLSADIETHRRVRGTRAGYHDARARLHRYVMERGAIPRLRPTEDIQARVLKARAAGEEHERDHEAEWLAFVAEHVDHFPRPTFAEGFGPHASAQLTE